jgi:2,4-dienoyl-CoA reductase-like NADH-dependent reductase (Old Yellow Enzyme family)
MRTLFDSVHFACGQTMRNRFMLAPMTNTQSHEDGTLSDEEFHWLTMRAQGRFGMTMTCASHVQANGKGFPGQLGIFDDSHIPGHTRLAKAILDEGSLAVVQLHHAGIRSPQELVEGGPVGPSIHEKSNSRALSLAEVHKLRDDFIQAGVRANKCGYHGVEIHGAHGYILCQFLSSKYNVRQDPYGGSLENRSRLIFEIIRGIREACGPQFLIGLRLSPERFGMRLEEIKAVCKKIIGESLVDFLDISLWDCFKEPEETEHQGRSLLAHFTALDFKDVRLTVAGNIRTGADCLDVLEAGVDFVSIGRAAILHHNFPELVRDDKDFQPTKLPVSETYLRKEGLSERFVNYMRRWPGFVK